MHAIRILATTLIALILPVSIPAETVVVSLPDSPTTYTIPADFTAPPEWSAAELGRRAGIEAIRQARADLRRVEVDLARLAELNHVGLLVALPVEDRGAAAIQFRRSAPDLLARIEDLQARLDALNAMAEQLAPLVVSLDTALDNAGIPAP